MPKIHFPEKYIPLSNIASKLNLELEKFAKIKQDDFYISIQKKSKIINKMNDTKNITPEISFQLSNQKDELDDMINNFFTKSIPNLDEIYSEISKFISVGLTPNEFMNLIDKINYFLKEYIIFSQEVTRKELHSILIKIVEILGNIRKGEGLKGKIIEYYPNDKEYMNYNCVISEETGQVRTPCKDMKKSSEFLRNRNKFYKKKKSKK